MRTTCFDIIKANEKKKKRGKKKINVFATIRARARLICGYEFAPRSLKRPKSLSLKTTLGRWVGGGRVIIIYYYYSSGVYITARKDFADDVRIYNTNAKKTRIKEYI